MTSFWWGVAAVPLTILFIGLCAALAFAFVILLARQTGASQECGWCDREWQDGSLLQEWINNATIAMHVRRDHAIEYEEWRTDYKSGGLQYAQEEKMRRRRERREYAKDHQ